VETWTLHLLTPHTIRVFLRIIWALSLCTFRLRGSITVAVAGAPGVEAKYGPLTEQNSQRWCELYWGWISRLDWQDTMMMMRRRMQLHRR